MKQSYVRCQRSRVNGITAARKGLDISDTRKQLGYPNEGEAEADQHGRYGWFKISAGRRPPVASRVHEPSGAEW